MKPIEVLGDFAEQIKLALARKTQRPASQAPVAPSKKDKKRPKVGQCPHVLQRHIAVGTAERAWEQNYIVRQTPCTGGTGKGHLVTNIGGEVVKVHSTAAGTRWV